MHEITPISLDISDRGVSPVIGIILMVAVVVVLGTAVSVFVFGIGDTASTATPSTNVDVDEQDSISSGEVTFKHSGGDELNPENSGEFKISGSSNTDVVSWFGTASTSKTYTIDKKVSAGDEIVTVDVGNADGETVALVWTSPDGGTSSTIGTYNVPGVAGSGSSPNVGVSGTNDGDNTIGVTVS